MSWGRSELCRKHFCKNSSSLWATLGLEQALSALEEGTFPPPSIEIFSNILFECRRQRARKHALRLHTYMRTSNLEALSSLGNHLVATLVDMGSLRDAQQVFNGLEYRNDMSWYALITGYAKQGSPHLALLMYTEMQDDDRVNLSGRTFVALLKACSMLQDFDKGLEIHAEVARLGLLVRDVFVGSTLVDFYAKCGSICKAKQVFHKLENQDVVLWNALITGYVNHGFGDEALCCFQQLQYKGIQPNGVTYICSLKACRLMESTEKILAIHAEIERKDLLRTDHLLSSTLVDTYAKCGCLMKAQAVFDALPVHNVVSWTALILGYADHQHGQAALAAYTDMQAEGIFPNGVTYVCLLKACGCQKAGEAGRELHCEISRMASLESDLKVGNALVDMYIKCGLLVFAREVFDNLVHRDVVSWNTLLDGYAEEGLGKEALTCFEHMQSVHIPPNAVTFASVLKACANSKFISKGQQLHADINKKGLFKGEPVIGNALVVMYAKCGLLEEAEHVFSALSSQDVISWNALLVGYAEHEHGDSVLELFELMKRAFVCPDAISFSCSLKACGSIGERDKGQQINADIEKLGLFDRNPSIGSALVDMYAKCGLLVTSQHLFDKLSVRDAVAWNAMILGYADCECGEKALELYEEMRLQNVPPDIVTFVGILKACGSVGAINQGKELHAELARQNMFEVDVSLGNTLIDMYAKCNMLSASHEVFDRLPYQDTVSWNVLLAGYTNECQGEKALKEFKRMQHRGVSLDDITFVTCLKACSSVGALDEGQSIHSQIEERGFFYSALINGQLVDMYAKFGLLTDAQYIFNKLSVQDLCLWNVLIAGYTDHGQSEKALECLEQLQWKGVSPDVITYAHALKACGALGATCTGINLHCEITKKGLLEKDITLGNTLIGMYVKCGFLNVAQSVFDRLPFRDMGSWNALIAGYDELNDSEDVFMVFEKMLGETKPDSVTFILILNACSRRGLLNKASQYFEGMSKEYGIDPTGEHHTCMADLLGRTGQLWKAMASIRQLPCSPDPAIWHTILGACERAGNVQLGRQAFEHAFNLEQG